MGVQRGRFMPVSKECNLLPLCCAWEPRGVQSAVSDEAPICGELRMGCQPGSQGGIAYFGAKCAPWAGVRRLPALLCFGMGS